MSLYRHFSVRHTPNWGHGGAGWYSVAGSGQQHASLAALVASLCACADTEPGLGLGAVCLVPNPVADSTVLRSWELELEEDRWMVPR